MLKPDSEISRQARWQRKHRAMGLCVLCSEPAFKGWRCEKHYEQHKITMRLRYIPKVRGRYNVRSKTDTEGTTKPATRSTARKKKKAAKSSGANSAGTTRKKTAGGAKRTPKRTTVTKKTATKRKTTAATAKKTAARNKSGAGRKSATGRKARKSARA